MGRALFSLPSGCRAGAAAVFLALAAEPLRAETVYEFTTSCQALPARACLNRVAETLDAVKTEAQGRAFCMPEAWATPGDVSRRYPISLLDHLRLGLSAARFGKAQVAVEDAMRDILKDIYPCD